MIFAPEYFFPLYVCFNSISFREHTGTGSTGNTAGPHGTVVSPTSGNSNPVLGMCGLHFYKENRFVAMSSEPS